MRSVSKLAPGALVAALAVGLVVLSSACFGAAKRGDVNKNGTVDLPDAVLALKLVVGLTAPGPEAPYIADVSPFPAGDGRVGLDDAIRILRHTVGLVKAEEFFPPAGDPTATLPTALHGSGVGKRVWYSAQNGGFEGISGIPYENLACKNCHQPKCDNCHEQPGAAVAQSKCEGCHSRQMAEVKQGYSDVHRDRGMGCKSCHTKREMHGDGVVYSSMLESGAMDASCETCHPASKLPVNTAHTIHSAKVDCSACHTQSVVTCYNCHFESEVNLGKKVPYGQFKDWMFLMNRNGKVYPANFQSVSYQGKTFIAMAPFYSHTVKKEGRQCDECHNSPAVQQYKQSGKIDVVKWNDAEGKLEQIKGVVPVIPGYKADMRFDFVDLKDDKWQFLKTGVDQFQLMWGEPLTEEQMKKLAR